MVVAGQKHRTLIGPVPTLSQKLQHRVQANVEIVGTKPREMQHQPTRLLLEDWLRVWPLVDSRLVDLHLVDWPPEEPHLEDRRRAEWLQAAWHLVDLLRWAQRQLGRRLWIWRLRHQVSLSMFVRHWLFRESCWKALCVIGELRVDFVLITASISSASVWSENFLTVFSCYNLWKYTSL